MVVGDALETDVEVGAPPNVLSGPVKITTISPLTSVGSVVDVSSYVTTIPAAVNDKTGLLALLRTRIADATALPDGVSLKAAVPEEIAAARKADEVGVGIVYALLPI
jgi:hypothetical protein